jgi:hypothetical protein
MSKRAAHAFSAKILSAAAVAAIIAATAPAFAVDPVIDPMRPNTDGLTATAPRQAEREQKRDVERTPTLTERFGLPPVSGPLPPILPPLPQPPPTLVDPGPNALPPPPQPRPLRARQFRDRDG